MRDEFPINPLDLRLGSYVRFRDGAAVIVESILYDKEKWYLRIEGEPFSADLLFPVKLNAGWLGRFGFEFDDEQNCWIDDFTEAKRILFCNR